MANETSRFPQKSNQPGPRPVPKPNERVSSDHDDGRSNMTDMPPSGAAAQPAASPVPAPSVSPIATPDQSPPADPVVPVDVGAGFIDDYRQLDLRNDQVRWGFFQRAVGYSYRLPNEPAIAETLNVQLPPECALLQALEALMKRMEPPNRNGEKRASKQLCALSVLIEDGVPVDKIAEVIERRGGIGKLAGEHARRNRSNAPAGQDEPPTRQARFNLPPGTIESVVLLYRPDANIGKNGRAATQVIGVLPASTSAAEVKRHLQEITGFSVGSTDTSKPN